MTVVRDLEEELNTYTGLIEKARKQVENLNAEIAKIDLPKVHADLNREKRELDALRRTDLSGTVQQETRRLREQELIVQAKAVEVVELKSRLDETNKRLVAAHFDEQTQKRELKAKQSISTKSHHLAKKSRENERKLSESVRELEDQQRDLGAREERLHRDHAQVKTERDILRTQLGLKDAQIAALRDDIQLKSSLLRTRQERINRMNLFIQDQAKELETETRFLEDAKCGSDRLDELELRKHRAEAELVEWRTRVAKQEAKSATCVNIHPLRELDDPQALQVIETNKLLRAKLTAVYKQIAHRKRQIADLTLSPVT